MKYCLIIKKIYNFNRVERDEGKNVLTGCKKEIMFKWKITNTT